MFGIIKNLLHDCEGGIKIYSPSENYHISHWSCPPEIWFSLGELIFISPSESRNKCVIIILKGYFFMLASKKKNKDIKTYQWTLRKRTNAPEYWVLEMIHLKTSLATLGKISGTRGRRTNCHSCFPPEKWSYIYSQFRFGNCYGKWNTHCFFEIVIVKTFPCLSAENHIQ